jgi:hypothetical protein
VFEILFIGAILLIPLAMLVGGLALIAGAAKTFSELFDKKDRW